MPFETSARSNNYSKAAGDLFAIVLADSAYRPEPGSDEASLPRPYSKFLDSQSLFELTLRRIKKVISPKRLSIIVRRKHVAIGAAAAQINMRAQHTIVLQSRRADATAALFVALMGIYRRCPAATVALFPVDHFVTPECAFLRQLSRAWSALDRDEKALHILLLGMEPDSADLGYCYIVPEHSLDPDRLDTLRRISLVGRLPNAEIAQRLITGGALWHSGIIVAKCMALIDAFRQAMPVLADNCPLLEAAASAMEPNDDAERVYRSLPSMSAFDILRSLPWKHRRGLAVMPIRGVYWSELSNQWRERKCLEKMVGLKRDGEEKAALLDRRWQTVDA